jgi:hypothetical protein
MPAIGDRRGPGALWCAGIVTMAIGSGNKATSKLDSAPQKNMVVFQLQRTVMKLALQ